MDDDDPALRNSGPMEWLSPEDLKGKIVIRDRPQKKLTKSERNLLKMPQTSSRQVELTKPNTGLGKSPIVSVDLVSPSTLFYLTDVIFRDQFTKLLLR